jgi:hypothetical protein
MSLDATADRLTAARARLDALRPAVERGEPWPASPAFGVEPEASWNPPELLAHLVEMLAFWPGQIERILDGVEPVPFGRVQSDDARIAAIGRDRALPAAELYRRLDAGIDEAVSRLHSLDAAEAGRVGVHPTRGRMTVDDVATVMLAAHLEEHVDQLEAILGSVSPGAAPR